MKISFKISILRKDILIFELNYYFGLLMSVKFNTESNELTVYLNFLCKFTWKVFFLQCTVNVALLLDKHCHLFLKYKTA